MKLSCTSLRLPGMHNSLFVLLGFVSLATACVSREHHASFPAQERSTVGAFSAVRSDGPVDVRIAVIANAQPSVKVACDPKVIGNIVTRVEGDALIIESKNLDGWHIHFFSSEEPYDRCVVDVTAPTLVSVSAHGSGDVSVRGETALSELATYGSGDVAVDSVTSARLHIETAGSGDVKLHALQTSDLRAETSGSGTIQVAGSAEEITLRTNGSGDIDADSLTSAVAHITTSGSGDVSVFATRRIEAQGSGSGDLRVHGRPAQKEVVMHGSGSVHWD